MQSRAEATLSTLAGEIRLVVKLGLRPRLLFEHLDGLGQLLSMIESPDDGPVTSAALVTSLCHALQVAIEELGNGPYGKAAACLFGAQPSVRGLLLPSRRTEAAAELGVNRMTFIRHWEKRIIDDVAFAVFAGRPTRGQQRMSND